VCFASGGCFLFSNTSSDCERLQLVRRRVCMNEKNYRSCTCCDRISLGWRLKMCYFLSFREWTPSTHTHPYTHTHTHTHTDTHAHTPMVAVLRPHFSSFDTPSDWRGLCVSPLDDRVENQPRHGVGLGSFISCRSCFVWNCLLVQNFRFPLHAILPYLVEMLPSFQMRKGVRGGGYDGDGRADRDFEVVRRTICK
jgi:hypothetical protein